MAGPASPDPAPLSMTGFGSAQGPSAWGLLRVDVRTLNHRYLDVTSRLPRGWPPLDARIRERVAARLVRGRVEVSVVAQEFEATRRSVRLNAPVLRQYWEQLTQIQQELRSSAGLSLSDLLSLPEVVSVEEPPVEEEAAWAAVGPLLDAALDQAERMRRAEGARLWQEISARLGAIDSALERLQEENRRLSDLYYQRLLRRMRELVAMAGEGGGSPGLVEDEALRQRLAQEAAIAAERADVAEELERLRGHVSHLRQLAAEAAPGRRMEFLLREMDRELSTATAKAAQAGTAHLLIELRAEVERIREQALNLE